MTDVRRFPVLSVAFATFGTTFVARDDEVATVIHRCDLPVAIDKDADKPLVEKVFFKQTIDATVAVPACEAAAKAAPKNGPIAFQLGLAYDFEEQPRAPQKSTEKLARSAPAQVKGLGPKTAAKYSRAFKMASPGLREIICRRFNDYLYFPQLVSTRDEVGIRRRPYFVNILHGGPCF